jgi:murein DD-endopeptidase MepM/ murein hydrolase activator NlpD
MKRTDFLRTLKSPLPNAVLKKFPYGSIMQYWSESPELYSIAFGQLDDLHHYLGGHSGIDISTFHGDPVCAAHDGVVDGLREDRTGLGGLVVYLNSPELEDADGGICRIQTAYGHLDRIVVSQGEHVTRGQIIGYEGNTGFVVSGGTPYWGDAPTDAGTHLHFALYEHIKVNGTWRFRYSNPMMNSSDPLPYISDPTPFDDVADGNLSGLRNVLENARRYLLSLVK